MVVGHAVPVGKFTTDESKEEREGGKRMNNSQSMQLRNNYGTTFEPDKMSAMVVSQKCEPFDVSGIFFNGEELS